MKEIADRGLSLIEINPAGVSAMYRLTVELGVGYARSSTVLDYKLAGQGSIDSNLERLVDWAERALERQAAASRFRRAAARRRGDRRHRRLAQAAQRARARVALVPIIGHFECREACMARVRAQPAQLRAMKTAVARILPPECRADADRRRAADLRRPPR